MSEINQQSEGQGQQGAPEGNDQASTQLAVITGGRGFLGVHLCRSLIEKGWRVRSLARGHSETLASMGVEQARVDVTDRGALLEACEGADALYHLAGRVSRDPEEASSMYTLHLRGTQNFIHVVETLKLTRALYLSTSGVVGVSESEQLADEESEIPWPLVRRWPYYESKAFAEEEVRRACERGLPIKIARPALFLGPGDPTGDSHTDVLLFLGGDIKAALPGGLCAVDARDVASFLPTLMEKGTPGVGYLLGAQNLSVRAYLNQIAQISGIKAPLLDLPKGWIDRAEGPLKWISKQKAFGGIDPLTFEMGCHFWYIDSARAIEIGFEPRPLSETLLDALRDLNDRGFYASV